jgi:nucleotide-binding universal stress UspA family protein
MLPLRTILYPTDFSEPSRYAFELAHALARDYGARLVVLHVGLPPVIAYGEGVLPLDLDAYVLEANAKLRQIKSDDPAVTVEHCLVMERDPVPEILRAAEAMHCELIVMGTHGRTGLRRMLMGSVAEAVLRKARCPVLTVKMPFPRAQAAPVGAGSAAERPVA